VELRPSCWFCDFAGAKETGGDNLVGALFALAREANHRRFVRE